ncbi:WecB/TagA/CpsF family glycosyltransferase [Candidatus Uhrbacteria bacterium]|jgi:N-acetylglucosaminyldiphosphoundecaprenol N-acetyl-beta-D-mannosaminyltransferase|nr:WecB/TagA/CpsF family glycosyltransferase [Candidatus Uhrbacteria bacterium]
MQSHSILNVRIDDLATTELVETFSDWLETGKSKIVVTPNPEMLLLSMNDSVFRGRINGADLSLPDGVGLRYATAALTDGHLAHRHTGVDSVELLARLCKENGKRLLLLGGDPGSADVAAKKLAGKYEGLDVHGIDPGKVEFENGRVTIERAIETVIERLEPDVIAVAFGQRKQDAFIERYLSQFSTVKIAIGVGGAFEMISGKKIRGPKWMRKVGLEFIWRMLIEPRRAGRIIRASIIFPVVVAVTAYRGKRLKKAIKNVFPEVIRQLINK